MKFADDMEASLKKNYDEVLSPSAREAKKKKSVISLKKILFKEEDISKVNIQKDGKFFI
jgi:hypothetical protein